jgi:serine/threonine-protein kinase
LTLEPGRTLAHYRLLEKIGEGGMGVVWRARDGRLDRDVAIKLLPEAFSRDRERLARFEREARLLAALNHPNVAAIYGLESAAGVHFLVLELVPGRSLAEVLAAGPLPVEEALEIARQVAEGLEAAHAAGVIHRDLKPANVKVTPEGQAKVLDFGLAKGAAAEAGPGADLSLSPTLTAGTQAGAVLGTAHYMSPEQARGKPLDRRTDVWSFGCLVYECLAGATAFRGETVADLLSAILQAEPDWSALPERTPPRVRDLLERCLAKSPRNRLRDLGDARIELDRALAGREWAGGAPRAAEAPAPRRSPWRAVALVAAGAGLGAGALLLGRPLWAPAAGRAVPVGVVRFAVAAPPNAEMSYSLVSPDGVTIAYGVFDRAAEERRRAGWIALRRLDHDEESRVAGSEHAVGAGFSPDGRWLAFVAPVAAESTKRRLFKVPVEGGAPPPPVDLDPGGARATFAVVAPLPDGRHVLGPAAFFEGGAFRFDVAAIDVENGKARVLAREGTFAAWSPTGHLLFSRGDTLLAAPFDPHRLELTGVPIAVAAGLRTENAWQGAWFQYSPAGTLVYLPGAIGGTRRRLILITPDGRAEPWDEAPRAYVAPLRVTADGRRLAATVTDPTGGLFEIWISDLDRPRLRPFVAEPGLDCTFPVWSPDGDRLAYSCGRTGEAKVYLRDRNGEGAPRTILEAGGRLEPLSFSPDGSKMLLARVEGDRGEILLLPLAGPDAGGSPRVLLAGQSSSGSARLSPDGRCVAYASDESGRFEVYVRELLGDRLGPPHQVSAAGGGSPVWRPAAGGSTFELYYREAGRGMVASITTRPRLEASEPRALGIDGFALRLVGGDVLPDGRVLAAQQGEDEQATRIQVVLNFDEEIRRRFAAAR